MMRFRESAIILPFIALLCGCATLQQKDWYNKAHDATVNATDVAKEQCGKALGIASDRTKKALG